MAGVLHIRIAASKVRDTLVERLVKFIFLLLWAGTALINLAAVLVAIFNEAE